MYGYRSMIEFLINVWLINKKFNRKNNEEYQLAVSETYHNSKSNICLHQPQFCHRAIYRIHSDIVYYPSSVALCLLPKKPIKFNKINKRSNQS